MTKLKWADNEKYMKGLLKDNVAVLIYGPNRGQVNERADAMKKTILGDAIGDPFRDFTLSQDVLEESPHALAEEAATPAFGGEQKFIRLKNPPKSAATSMEEILQNANGSSFVLVTCEELSPSDSWRKLFESASNAGACACYIANNAGSRISVKLQTEGIRIERDALQFLSAQLRGQDNGIIDMELEKLSLYAAESKNLSLDEVSLICGSGSEVDISNMLLSCLAGRSLEDLDKGLTSIFKSGDHQMLIIRSLVNTLRKVADLKRKLAEGADFKSAAKSLRIFFKLEDDFQRACNIWSDDDIFALITKVQMVEMQSKANYGFEKLILARTLQGITAQAVRLAKRR